MPTRTFIQMEGFIHLALNSEHLLCNMSTFDAADTEGDESLRWHPTTRSVVTCPVCVEIVELCRGVRTKKVPYDL